MNMIKNINNEVINIIENSKGDVIFRIEEDITNLDDIDLSDANLENIKAEGIICAGTKFVRANLKNADLYMSFMVGADFTHACLEGTNFQGSNLTDAVFVGANLRNANFGVDNMGGSVRMQGANLRDAILDSADLIGAEYNADTVFPADFVPEDRGMVRTS